MDKVDGKGKVFIYKHNTLPSFMKKEEIYLFFYFFDIEWLSICGVIVWGWLGTM